MLPRRLALAATGLIVGVGAVPTLVDAASGATPTTVLGTVPGPGTSSSPKSVVADALTAARTEGSVHFVETASAGKQSLSVTGDVSPTKGRQTITVRYGSSVGHMSGLWAADHVYFEGDSYGLQSFLGMSATLARKYKNRWIAFSKSDPGFVQTAKQFTVQGPLSEISLTGQLSMTGLAVIDGVSAQGVRGKTMALSSNGGTGTGTLYVANTGTGLPVRFTGTGHQSAGTANARVDFSSWGESVDVQAPTDAIAQSKVK